MGMHASRNLALISALALSACALPGAPPRDETAKQAAPNLTLPAQWLAAGGRQGAVADNWLASWNDPALNALVAEGLAYNTDLRLAATRVEPAEAYLRVAGVAAVAAGEPPGPRRREDGRRLQRPAGRRPLRELGARPLGSRAGREGRSRGPVRVGALDADTRASRSLRSSRKRWVLAIEARLAKARAEEMQCAPRAVADARARSAACRRRRRLRRRGSRRPTSKPCATRRAVSRGVRERAARAGDTRRALPRGAVAVAAAPALARRRPLGLPSELLERRPDSSPPNAASPRRSIAPRKRKRRGCRGSRWLRA